MSSKNTEIERLTRLRQQQIKARDPHAKQREIGRRVAARRRRIKSQDSFWSIVTDVPHKWQGIILGAFVGMVISIVLSLLVQASWVDAIGLGAIIALSVVGFFFGQAFDVRDELRDLANK